MSIVSDFVRIRRPPEYEGYSPVEVLEVFDGTLWVGVPAHAYRCRDVLEALVLAVAARIEEKGASGAGKR